LTLILFPLSLVSAQTPKDPKPLLITNVTLIPMTADRLLEHQDVLVEAGRFKSIHPHKPGDVDSADFVINGAGKFLIPGLADLHMHFKGPTKIQPDMAFLYIANGVTTVLNMNGHKDVLTLRDQINAGEIPGPRIFTTGRILGNITAHPDTFADGESVVAKQKAEGYDFIKVYNQIPAEGYRGIIAGAKKHNIRVMGHAVRSVGIEGAIANGQDVVHMEEFIYGYFQDGLDESRIRPLAKRLRQANIKVVATLIAYHNIIRQLEDLDAMLRTPGVEYLPDVVARKFYKDRNPYLLRFDQDTLEKRLKPEMAFQQKLARIFHEEGVLLVTGTDAVLTIVVPGFSLHDELREFVDAGISNQDALAAATVKAAQFLEKQDDFGTIHPGQSADAVLLSANPLDDIDNTKKIEAVLYRGTWLPRTEIDAKLQDIKTRIGHTPKQ
jgi:imidazolonepropionase-like amidohydrolase